MNWAAGIIALGAIFACTSVLMVFQLGQPRIFFSMARDGLLPPWAAKIHPKYRTPHVTTILTGVAVAAFSSFTNINEVVELTNIGTLFAFALVSAGILVLRYTDPHREAAVPDAARAARADAVDRQLRGADDPAPGADLVAVRDLARGRPRDLLPLRVSEEQAPAQV